MKLPIINFALIDVGEREFSLHSMIYSCFLIAQLEVEIIKTLERSDLLRFYDQYISPQSKLRRKLSVHVKPSSLVEKAAESEPTTDDSSADINKEKTDKILPEDNINLPEV